jgi:hypothetical protein
MYKSSEEKNIPAHFNFSWMDAGHGVMRLLSSLSRYGRNAGSVWGIVSQHERGVAVSYLPEGAGSGGKTAPE